MSARPCCRCGSRTAGRSPYLSVWFPRLEAATDEHRNNWRLIGRGVGIHWPDLDEDISVANLLASDGELIGFRESAPATPPPPAT